MHNPFYLRQIVAVVGGAEVGREVGGYGTCGGSQLLHQRLYFSQFCLREANKDKTQLIPLDEEQTSRDALS